MVLAAGRKRLTTCDAEEDRTLSVFVEQPVAVVLDNPAADLAVAVLRQDCTALGLE